MRQGFRHEAPRPRADWIERPRLIARLARRVDVQVMVLVAPAGYGKTTALAQAVAAAAPEARHDDLWVQCTMHDADADVLGQALLRAAGIPIDDTAAGITADEVIDALLRFAPRHVCVILDDVHTIDRDSGGMDLLRRVIERLPTNAHVVLSSRSTPAVPLSRRLLAGAAELIEREEFEYDDDEVDRAFGSVDHDQQVRRWPALTHLRTSSREGPPGVSFLLEEIAEPLGSDVVGVLAALSTLTDIDRSTLEAITTAVPGRETAELIAILADLPLVHRLPDGRFQMHDLWRQALDPHLTSLEQAATALHAIGEHRLEHGRYHAAAELFAAARRADSVTTAALGFSSQPLMFVSDAEVRRMATIASSTLGEGLVADLIAAALPHVGLELGMAAAFADVAHRAAAAGESRVEAIALQNVMNLHSIVDPLGIPEWISDRSAVLARDGDPVAAIVNTIVRSHRARGSGDHERSVEALAELRPSASPMAPAMLAFGLGDLGRPEEVGTAGEEGDATEAAARAGGQYLAQAIWLRGEVSPELALVLGGQLASATDDRGIPHLRVSTNAVLSFVALAAGNNDAAEQFLQRANRWRAHTMSTLARSLASVADAALRCCQGREDLAFARLEATLAELPIGRWPPRPYLYSLPLVFLASGPADRAVLERCSFGPALTVARDAGMALVALREHGDPAPASRLPWGQVDLLRAHVLPPHLAQLAAAAAGAGCGGVEPVLAAIPRLREHLSGAESLDEPVTSAWARDRRSQLPVRPEHDLHVDLLGQIRLRRGHTEVTESSWSRRERVQQLLALVLLHGRIPRRRVQELLWPELPADRAASNLRVNLTHLQKVLQPTRGADDQPWFVTSVGDSLVAATEGVVLDTARFEALTTEARQLDHAGRTTLAIERFRTAASLYRGDLLSDQVVPDWVEVERVRLRSLSTATFSRLGELVLARGEPEEAASWAARAIRLEPLHERSTRLFIQALLAQDDRAAASRAMHDLIARLRLDGLAPDRDTTTLAQRLGVVR